MKKITICMLFIILICSSFSNADHVITSNANSGAGTLRQAIVDAGDNDTITFNLASGSETIELSSELSITKNLTINGHNDAGSGTAVTIQVTTPGTSAWRVFNINASGKTINISNMTIQGGDITPNYGGGIYFKDGTLNLNHVTVSNSKAYYGGGIFMATPTGINTLNITNSTISGNTATTQGGGLFCIHTCTVDNSTISGNTANYGGGVYNNNHGDGGTFSLENTIISGNNVTTDGGGIYNNGTCTIENSTISGNTSSNRGAGVGNSDPCTITNSTISGNTATAHGGGIWSNDECTIINTTIYNNTANSSTYGGGGLLNSGTFTIINSTISGNNAPNKYGGGIYNYSTSLTVKSSMIANNTANSTGLDYYYNGGTLTDQGYNIVEDQAGTSTGSGKTFTAGTNIIGDQSNLWGTGISDTPPLEDNNTLNGTQTLAVISGSVAIGAGNYDASITTDQRGAIRHNPFPTIGAYEYYDDQHSLPVELSAFTAQFIENTLTIHWSTQSETDNMGWFIYRSVENDFSSSKVISKMIEGHGTTTEQQFYTYEDDLKDAEVGDSYYYWLESIDYSGIINHYDRVAILTIPEHSDPGNNGVTEPERFGLFQNEPNPVISSTRISFNLRETSKVDLTVYNLKGQLMKKIYSGNTSKHIVTWDGKDDNEKQLENGVYFYTLTVNGKTEDIKKLILMR